MSSGRGAGEAQRLGSPPTRMIRVWRGLPHERRLAALACVGLFLTLFLPWYQETVFANGVSTLRSASSSLTGWGAFSFVEAAVLLVSASVLLLLFVRAEGQAFHVPGGDGGVITAAGLWTCVLIIWRIFDKQGTSRHGQIAYTSGIEWGIFVALAVAALLAYAGSLIRLAHEPEPPLPGEPESAGAIARPPRRGWLRRGGKEPRRRAAPRAYPGPDMGADDDWTQEFRARREPASPPPAPREPSEAPTRADPAEAPTRRVRPRSIGASGERAGATTTRPATTAAPEAPEAPQPSQPSRTAETPATRASAPTTATGPPRDPGASARGAADRPARPLRPRATPRVAGARDRARTADRTPAPAPGPRRRSADDPARPARLSRRAPAGRRYVTWLKLKAK